jgi:hypothetical protein
MRRLAVLQPAEAPRVFAHGDGSQWRRDGACNRCGACCESGDPLTGELGTCAMMARDEEGLAVCTDRSEANTYYHNACVHWPSHPAQISDKPDCSYRFHRV